jgi:uncharacterized membrane protein YgcG
MNEQQLADLFSEQLDRLLEGEAINLPPEAGDVPELLNLVGQPAAHSQFQASAATQAAFQSQLAGWFGLASGGTMTILGLSKVWFISILVTVVTVVTGTGFLAVVTTSLLVFGSGLAATTPTKTPIATPVLTGTVTASPVASTTVTPVGTPTIPTPAMTPTVVVTGTPGLTPTAQLPPIIFIGHIQIPRLCAGVYTAQSTLVNVGQSPVDNAALAWEVMEGADLVETVGFDSASLIPVVDTGAASGTDPAAGAVSDPAAVVAANTPLIGAVEFQPISVEQDIKLEVKVKVKDDWWKHESETKIKIKLSVKNKFDLHPGHSQQSQIITIVRQDAQWVSLVGFPHNLGENRMLVNGHIVVTNNCTGLPANWPPGSKVQVVGWLQPDGTFIAINIIVVNITIITGDFDSGVPLPRPGGSGDSDGGSGGGGGSGGSKGGSGGSGGSKGGSK